MHERLSGHASRVRVLDRILTRLREHDDVWWARKDETAESTLDHPDTATRLGNLLGALDRQDVAEVQTHLVWTGRLVEEP